MNPHDFDETAFENPTPEWRRCNARIDSDANAALNRILALLAEAGEEIDAFLGEHGPACRCPFCPGNRYLPSLLQDLRGAGWVLGMCESAIDSVTIPVGGRPADDADAPVLVEGGAR